MKSVNDIVSELAMKNMQNDSEFADEFYAKFNECLKEYNDALKKVEDKTKLSLYLDDDNTVNYEAVYKALAENLSPELHALGFIDRELRIYSARYQLLNSDLADKETKTVNLEEVFLNNSSFRMLIEANMDINEVFDAFMCANSRIKMEPYILPNGELDIEKAFNDGYDDLTDYCAFDVTQDELDGLEGE